MSLKDWNRIKSYNQNQRHHHAQVIEIMSMFDDIDTFVDCGAGEVGSEAWSVRDLKPNCHIIGLEPQHERYELLKNNNYPGELIKAAVSDKCGIITGFMGFEGGDTQFVMFRKDNILNKGFKKEEVKTLTVDSLLTNAKSAFVWADIEGAEMAMLRGCQESIKNGIIKGFLLELRKEVYSVEETEEVSDVNKAFKFMEEHGYKSISGRHIEGTHRDFIFVKEDI
jgi:FkbM family methyltransferase